MAVPEAFLDKVTYEIMIDPVMTCDGITFERATLDRWFREGHTTNPFTGAAMASTAVTPNIALRQAIAEWRAAHCKEIPRTAITIGQQVGRGSFKVVYQGTLRLPGSRQASAVAVMKVRCGDVGAEADILLQLGQHPRLVQFLGMCREEPAGERDDMLLITEFAPLGDLHSSLEKFEASLTPHHQLAMLQQICSGMEALAKTGLIHRDLAARNVLVFAYDPEDVSLTSVKVSDFGLTVNGYTAKEKYGSGGAKPIRGLAPEALQRSRYSEKSDVWAFGVTAWVRMQPFIYF
jgi:serine/threonine protein kinase